MVEATTRNNETGGGTAGANNFGTGGGTSNGIANNGTTGGGSGGGGGGGTVGTGGGGSGGGGSGAGVVVVNDGTSSQPLPTHVIIHGPPLSGRTTQARAVSNICDHVRIRVDDVIEEARQSPSLGADDAEGRSKIYRDVAPRLREFLQHLEEEQGGGGGSGGGGGGIGSTVKHSSFKVPAPDTASNGEADFIDQHASMPEDLMLEVLRARLQNLEGSKSYVVDGLDSKYTPNMATILKNLVKALGDQRKITFLHLTVDVPQMNARESAKQKAAEERDNVMLKEVKEITEDEYDNMTESGREAYDAALSNYKKKRKELQRKRDEERRHWEEELAARSERKAEEERQSKKKDKNRRVAVVPLKEKSDKSGSTSVRASRVNIAEREPPKASSDRLAGTAVGRLKEKEKSAFDDETSSRAELDDAEDAMLSDASYKQYEIYLRTLDNVLNLVKNQPAKPQVAEKKPSRAVKQPYGGAAAANWNETHNNGGAEEGDRSEDMSNVTYSEINGNNDEEIVTQMILSEVPPMEKAPVVKEETEAAVYPPYVEHVIYYPQERTRTLPQNGRLFTLYPNVPNYEENGLTGDGAVAVM